MGTALLLRIRESRLHEAQNPPQVTQLEGWAGFSCRSVCLQQYPSFLRVLGMVIGLTPWAGTPTSHTRWCTSSSIRLHPLELRAFWVAVTPLRMASPGDQSLVRALPHPCWLCARSSTGLCWSLCVCAFVLRRYVMITFSPDVSYVDSWGV